MSPPKLAADAPVPNILHPVEVHPGEPIGDYLYPPVQDNVHSRLCQALHTDEPLLAHQRLHGHGAAVTVPHGVDIRLYSLKQTILFQVSQYGFTALEPVHAFVGPGFPVHCAVQVHGGNDGQAMSLAHLEVHRIVSGCNLQRPSAESGVNCLIADNREGAIQHRKEHPLSAEVAVSFVIGIHRYCRIAQQGLRACGGHSYVAYAFLKGIPDVVEEGLLLNVLHLQVRQGRGTPRTPVDYPLSPVYESLVEQVGEGGADRSAGAFVQRKPTPAPVAGSSQALLLLVYGVAVQVDPLPNTLQELLPSQLLPGDPLLGQRTLHDHLCRYACVVGSGEPQRRVSLHPAPPGHYVFHSSHQSVAQMQLSRHVGWRHDDDEGFFGRVYLRREKSPVRPELVETLLHACGVVRLGDIGGALLCLSHI